MFQMEHQISMFHLNKNRIRIQKNECSVLKMFHKFSSPGTYVDTHRRRYRFHHSFGGPLKIIPAVRIVCTPQPLVRCQTCLELLRDEYFQNWRTKETLCRICMVSAVQTATYHTRLTALKARRLKELKELIVS